MSTKVHDEDDETFDEVDVILEHAKAGLQMKRSLERKTRRNINLSDIPENFAHVPPPLVAVTRVSPTPSPLAQLPVAAAGVCQKKVQLRRLLQATLKWLRGCKCRCKATSVHVPTSLRRRRRP